jgi:hypothetical protein
MRRLPTRWQCFRNSGNVTPVDPHLKLLSEYDRLLTQRLASYPLVLVGLSCGSSSFAKMTDELPTSRPVVALRRKGD